MEKVDSRNRDTVHNVMREKNLTQGDIAELIGSHRPAITRVLGSALIDPRSLWWKILDLLGLELMILRKDRLPEHSTLLPTFLEMELANLPVYEIILEQRLSLSNNSVRKALYSLEDSGYVESKLEKVKNGSGEYTDRVVWHITPKGRDLARNISRNPINNIDSTGLSSESTSTI